MHSAGWQVAGIESDGKTRDQVHERYGLEVFSPEDWFSSERSEFDMITLWHALEHLHGLNRYLRQIRLCLAMDGFLLVAVPNHTSLDASFYQSYWAAYDVPRHLYHFSYESMTALLDRYGFRVTRIKQLPFDPFYASILSEKTLGGSVLRGIWVGFRSYSKALSNARRSSSILFITTKKGSARNGGWEETLPHQRR